MSGERGTRILSSNLLKSIQTWRGRPITVDNECMNFSKIVKVASITVVIKEGTERE